MNNLEPIGDEVQRQLQRLQEQKPAADQDIWTPEDEARLQEELQGIVFEPSLANPNYPDRMVTIAGREQPIHFVNNFPKILVVMDEVRHGEAPQEKTFEAAYAAVAAERKYVEIFDRMEVLYPALYKRIRLIEEQRKTGTLEKSEEAANLRDYHKSKGFAAAAGIARQLDPNYDMTLLNP